MYNKLLENLEILKLEKIRSYLPNYLDAISKENISPSDALCHLTEKEIAFRDERASKIQIAVSAFPFEKTLSEFDFDYQPSINKNQIYDLANLRFMEKAENILFYGSSGVGNYRKFLFIERLLTKPHSNAIFIKKSFDNNYLQKS